MRDPTYKPNLILKFKIKKYFQIAHGEGYLIHILLLTLLTRHGLLSLTLSTLSGLKLRVRLHQVHLSSPKISAEVVVLAGAQLAIVDNAVLVLVELSEKPIHVRRFGIYFVGHHSEYVRSSWPKLWRLGWHR